MLYTSNINHNYKTPPLVILSIQTTNQDIMSKNACTTSYSRLNQHMKGVTCTGVDTKQKSLKLNKHSESIAKAIQVPYRPRQIFQEALLLQKQIKGVQVIPDLYHFDTN